MCIASLSKVLVTPKVPYLETCSSIKTIMQRCGIPGMSIAVLHKNQLIFAEAFGKRNRTDPYTIETLQPIATLTKTFTAAAIGELVAEGKVDWDTTPISAYLPDFQLKDPVLTSQITFTDLLSEYSGLPNNYLTWHNSTKSRKELIKGLLYFDNIPPDLGANFKTNDVMYAVAGEAAAHAAGATSIEQLVLDKVIRPLGLAHTGFSQSNMKQVSQNYALSHMAYSFDAAQKGENRIFPLDEKPYNPLAAALDVYSNVLDLVRWGKVVLDLGALDGKQVLNRMSVQETLKARSFEWNENPKYRWVEFDPIFSYGFGWMQDSFGGQRFFMAHGADIGFGSGLVIFPDQDLVIAMLANTGTFSHVCSFLPFSIAIPMLNLPDAKTIKDEKGDDSWIEGGAIPLAKEAYAGLELISEGIFLPIAVADRNPLMFADDLKAYVGVYSHPCWGEFKITLGDKDEEKEEKEKVMVKNDDPSSTTVANEQEEKERKDQVLRFQYNEYTSTLEHYDQNTFIATFDDVLFKMRALVSFLPNTETSQQGLPDSNEFPRENLQIQDLVGAIGISDALFSKTKV
ncbi:MAG: beta-lactamase/transpeptidase-like protein [Linnemannia elongata]|nr:MAG: beta-lactamase/transpeptidase-like protein [Linnemannia elongata]